MKKIKSFIVFVFFSIILSSMTCDNDPNYNKNLEIDGLISIEKKDTFLVNDILYFSSKFSRYLPEAGLNKNIDLLKTTGAEKFSFSFYLIRTNTTNFYNNLKESDLIIDKGAFDIKDYSTSSVCILNKVTNGYEFRGGIKLLEPGEYKLNIITEIRPTTFTNSISLNILTSVKGIESNIYNNTEYNFIVNN